MTAVFEGRLVCTGYAANNQHVVVLDRGQPHECMRLVHSYQFGLAEKREETQPKVFLTITSLALRPYEAGKEYDLRLEPIEVPVVVAPTVKAAKQEKSK